MAKFCLQQNCWSMPCKNGLQPVLVPGRTALGMLSMVLDSFLFITAVQLPSLYPLILDSKPLNVSFTTLITDVGVISSYLYQWQWHIHLWFQILVALVWGNCCGILKGSNTKSNILFSTVYMGQVWFRPVMPRKKRQANIHINCTIWSLFFKKLVKPLSVFFCPFAGRDKL